MEFDKRSRIEKEEEEIFFAEHQKFSPALCLVYPPVTGVIIAVSPVYRALVYRAGGYRGLTQYTGYQDNVG